MAQVNTKVVTAHIPLPLAEKVDQFAQRLDRSRGWIMNKALANWIEQEEERERLTYEAMADVDKGIFANHSDVLAWAESLENDEPLAVPHP